MSRTLGGYGTQLALMFGGAFAFLLFASGANSDEIDRARIQDITEGSWTLAEWNIDGATLRPPEVDGRFSLHGGVVMYFIERRTPGKEVFASGYGRYELTESSWSYHYEHFRTLLGAGTNTKVYNEPPWPGIRIFEFKTEGSKLILDDERDSAMFAFDNDGFAYLENGKIARVWTRVQE